MQDLFVPLKSVLDFFFLFITESPTEKMKMYLLKVQAVDFSLFFIKNLKNERKIK